MRTKCGRLIWLTEEGVHLTGCEKAVSSSSVWRGACKQDTQVLGNLGLTKLGNMDDQLAELLESAQACITALQSGSEDPTAAKEVLETLSLTWRNLRTTLDRVLSQQEEERGRLQKVGERAEFERLSAQSHIESLKEEVRELSRSLVELRKENGCRTEDSKTQSLVPNAEESGGMEYEPQTLQSDTPCTGMEHGQTTDAIYGESSLPTQTTQSQTITGVEPNTQAPSSGSGNEDVETRESAQPSTSGLQSTTGG